MNSIPQTNDFDRTEKQYSYRYSWRYTIPILLIGGLGTFFEAQIAVSDNKSWFWLWAIFFFLLFLFGAWLLIINSFSKLKLRITRDGIYLPSVWKWGSFTHIPFSKVSNAVLFKMQGNIFLQLSVGKKKYPITNTWLPSKGDFQEIVEIVQKQVPYFLDNLSNNRSQS